MSKGEFLFYTGLGLLALTVLLAVIFAIRKPKYQPDQVVGIGDISRRGEGDPATQLDMGGDPATQLDMGGDPATRLER